MLGGDKYQILYVPLHIYLLSPKIVLLGSVSCIFVVLPEIE